MLPTLQQCQKNILKSKAFLDYFPQLPQLREQEMCCIFDDILNEKKPTYMYLSTGGPLIVRFLGPRKNRTIGNPYY